MSRRLATTLIVAMVPVVLIGNTLWVLVNPVFVRAQYALPGVPAGVDGLSGDREVRLGAAGTWAVHPGGDGVVILERARLDDGRPAFTPREIRHMSDVRTVFGRFLAAWAAACVAASAAVLSLRRGGDDGAAARALLRGADVTLGATLLLALAMSVSFGDVFAGLHGVLFPAGSWRFPVDSALLKLYPDAFWAVAGASAAAIMVLQAVVVRLKLRS